MKTSNRISQDFTEEQVAAFLKILDDFELALPFLISLTDDECKGGIKMGDKSLGYMGKIGDYARQNPQFIPAYADMLEEDRDYRCSVGLFTIARKMATLLAKIEDTATIAGMEAFAASLMFYHSVKIAARQGAPGAQAIYDDLRKRFPGAGGSTEESTNKQV